MPLGLVPEGIRLDIYCSGPDLAEEAMTEGDLEDHRFCKAVRV